VAETIGLRELKKQRTHDTIVRVALELFSERGFQATTVADIAAAAEVAPSTVFTYFPTKEDIVFAGWVPFQESFRAQIEHRPAGESAIAAVRAWAMQTLPPLLADPTEELITLRRIIDSDERLQAQEYALMATFEEVLIREVARDLAVAADAPVARIVAGALIGAMGPVMTDGSRTEVAELERRLGLVFALIETGLTAVAPGTTD
jgi:AcrR family transcriptional regulator